MASTSTCDSGDTSNVAEPALATADREASSESPRLFIVCGRDRTVEQVRDLFGLCGAIRHLHLATDRSNKSRGFAFLQYEEAASAIAAIHRFDKTTLSDGHVLKVTVAREKARPSAASTPAAVKDSTISTQPGKLKRNQHSQDDRNETGGDGNATDGGAFPGKRQRSSPPTSAIAVATLPKLWKRSHAPFAKLIVATRLPDDEIADVLGGIIAQIERLYGEETGEMEKKSATPTAVLGPVPAAAKRKAPTALARPAADEGGNVPTAACESRSPRVECETVRPSKLKSQRTTAAQATPNNRPVFVRDRRRVPVDESDSSLDDASDASAGRRKRSNTEPDDAAGLGAAHARRRLSDLSELSLSPAGNSSPLTSKKRCSRRSSASSSSSTLPTFQDAPFRHVAPVFVPALPPAMAPPPIRRRRTGPRATLFFTSTVKFTLQELEAMFSVYEQFDHVQITKSFGRVKTMAYVAYASAEAARSVLSSFLDDNDGDDHGLMKLAYSDSDGPTSSFTVPPPSNSHVSTSAAGESTSSEITPPPPRVDAELAVPPTIPTENCWLMILYDRGLTNDAISSCAAACDGMEFMDIKMFRSTGESQGVAFVKFETEECAHAASQHLHNSEFPVGARKYLQAMVITDPALFSTAHGASVVAPPSTTYHPGEDGELGVVEARFAHLMSGTSEPPSGPVASMANAVSVEDEVVEREQFYPPRRPSDPAVGASAFVQQAGPLPPPHTAPPPYGFFQFGQPYPYGATGHSHHQLPHTYRQHPPPPFYPHGVYTDQPTWGYEGVYPMWPGEAGSPMLSDYSAYAWEPATPSHSVSSRAEPTSVFVSSSRPLDLSCLMKAIQDCPGVVGFTKQERDGVAFVVDFGEPRLAIEAATKLDGTMCNGNKLRVAVASGHRPPPSRRKRQRLDQRGRRK